MQLKYVAYIINESNFLSHDNNHSLEIVAYAKSFLLPQVNVYSYSIKRQAKESLGLVIDTKWSA